MLCHDISNKRDRVLPGGVGHGSLNYQSLSRELKLRHVGISWGLETEKMRNKMVEIYDD